MTARYLPGIVQAGSTLPAVGMTPLRPQPIGQRNYWRRTTAELDAAAMVQFPTNPVGTVFSVSASVGPTAAGEQWAVSLVQVNTNGQVGSSPLVTQQTKAQLTASTTLTPPPVVAQAWLSVGGTLLHLLAQSTQGGNDTLDLGGQFVATGEQITVVWWMAEQVQDAFKITSAWFRARGRLSALSQT